MSPNATLLQLAWSHCSRRSDRVSQAYQSVVTHQLLASQPLVVATPPTHPRMDGPVACLSHHPCLWQPHAASLEIQHASEIIVFINRNYFIFINSFLNLVWIKVLLMQFLEAWRSTVPMDQNISTSPQLQSRNHNITVMSQDITAILQHITSNQRLKQLYWNKSYNTIHYIKD